MLAASISPKSALKGDRWLWTIFINNHVPKVVRRADVKRLGKYVRRRRRRLQAQLCTDTRREALPRL